MPTPPKRKAKTTSRGASKKAKISDSKARIGDSKARVSDSEARMSDSEARMSDSDLALVKERTEAETRADELSRLLKEEEQKTKECLLRKENKIAESRLRKA